MPHAKSSSPALSSLSRDWKAAVNCPQSLLQAEQFQLSQLVFKGEVLQSSDDFLRTSVSAPACPCISCAEGHRVLPVAKHLPASTKGNCLVFYKVRACLGIAAPLCSASLLLFAFSQSMKTLEKCPQALFASEAFLGAGCITAVKTLWNLTLQFHTWWNPEQSLWFWYRLGIGVFI